MSYKKLFELPHFEIEEALRLSRLSLIYTNKPKTFLKHRCHFKQNCTTTNHF